MINKIIAKLENKSIVILGFGKEGESTYHFIRKHMGQIPLTIRDQNDKIKDRDDLKSDPNVTIITGENYLENLEEYDWIIKTPGISLKDISINTIKGKITSQIELLLEVAKERCIGITGTKGKSTTSSLIYEIIKCQKSNVVLVGNIGTPILDILEECDDNTIFVIEMSSHQLEFLKLSPHIGIVLNLFEDHLDHAGSVKHYHDIKMKMFENQTQKDFMIYCSDNENLNNLIKSRKFQSVAYSVNMKNTETADVYKKEDKIFFGEKEIYKDKDPRNIIGEHNLENIMVALLVNELLGLSNKLARKAVSAFKPLDYRLQKVGTVNQVEYYMDTLATIPEATIASIEALKNVNTLIFGGMDRGISYKEFIHYLKKCKIEHLICMPITGHNIGKKLTKENVYFVEDLEEAVKVAKEITKKNTICLLSPAASSYDKFKNYQEKGDKYKEYVLNDSKNMI